MPSRQKMTAAVGLASGFDEDHRRPELVPDQPLSSKNRDVTVLDSIRDFSAEHGADRITVVFSAIIDDETGAKLLALPEVVSVIFAVEPSHGPKADSDRVGWLRLDGRVGRFPKAVGTTLLMIGKGEAFGYELARLSLAQGGKTIGFDTPIGFMAPRSLKVVLVNCIWRGFERKLQRQLRTMVLSGRVRRIGLFELLHKRRLRHVFRAIANTPRQRRPPIPGRLVFVTGSLGPGGAERQLVNTLLGLSATGRKDLHLLVEQLSPAPYDFYLSKLNGAGVAITELSLIRARSDLDMETILPLMKGVCPAFQAELIRLIILFDRLRPEVVHAWQDGPSAKAGLAAAIVGINRIVLSWRSLAPVESGLYQPHYAPIFRELARCDNIVMLNNSLAGAKSYARWLRLDPVRIGVIRNSLDWSNLEPPSTSDLAAYRQEIGIPADAPVVGTIFRFGAEKRPMLWLEIAALIAERRPDVHFLMIGAGPLLRDVSARVEQLGLQDRVHVPGRSTTPALAFANMDVFLLTSVLEGLPNVIIEAGAMGVPVVSTDVGGVREALDHGKTGFAMATDKPVPLADKILQVLSDGVWRDGVRAQAPGWVRDRFHTNRMIGETIRAFEAS